MAKIHNDPGRWLWVTRPEYYLDSDGNDSVNLEPDAWREADDWWSCHRDTRRGDLVFLWRTMPKCDIGYLLRAESDAFCILDKPGSVWDYGCEYRPLYKFTNPLTKKDLDQIPAFEDWAPYRVQFQRRAFRIDPAYWQLLTRTLSKREPAFRAVLKKAEASCKTMPVLLEHEMEEALASDLRRLKPFGYDLELLERQLVLPEIHSRLDLLCQERKSKHFVVIELKNVRANHRTVGQTLMYMNWVRTHWAKRRPVKGLVISRGRDNRYDAAAKEVRNLAHLDLTQVGFE